jgi:hypothetical protein
MFYLALKSLECGFCVVFLTWKKVTSEMEVKLESLLQVCDSVAVELETIISLFEI